MRVKKIYKRILSMIVCAALMMGSFPMSVRAAEDTKVTVEKLEELAVPTKFPAKGMLQVQLVTDTSVDSDNQVHYTYEDIFLTVYVDAQKEVYADLEVLASHLGYRYVPVGDIMIITVNDANKLIFAADDMEVTYLNYFLTANVKMRKAPFMYEEKMYEVYIRSILLFPLLTNKMTGGIVAAPEVDEDRNFSGRYAYAN